MHDNCVGSAELSFVRKLKLESHLLGAVDAHEKGVIVAKCFSICVVLRKNSDFDLVLARRPLEKSLVVHPIRITVLKRPVESHM